MTTPIHVAVNLGAFLILMQVPNLEPNYTDLALMLGSNLIDLDHLIAKPIYHPRRNSFTTHPLHKQWRVLSALSVLLLFIRPLAFLGAGLLLHFLLDYLYNKRGGI
jgi:hypothetical protein